MSSFDIPKLFVELIEDFFYNWKLEPYQLYNLLILVSRWTQIRFGNLEALSKGNSFPLSVLRVSQSICIYMYIPLNILLVIWVFYIFRFIDTDTLTISWSKCSKTRLMSLAILRPTFGIAGDGQPFEIIWPRLYFYQLCIISQSNNF